MVGLIGLLMMAIVGLGAAGIYVMRFFAVPPTPPLAVTPVRFPPMPPAWTATPLPPPTPSPSLAPLSTPTPNPAFLPPDATQAVQMDKIEQQLADLRGLKLEVRQPRFLIPRPRVEEVLRGQPGAGAGGATAESADDVERAGADQAHP